MAEYVWWFLIVGLVAGGAVVAFFMADVLRRDEDIDATEREAEASLIAAQLAADGRAVDARTVTAVLRAHRDYRRLPPPDRLERAEGRTFGADESAATPTDDDGLVGLARPRSASARDRDADGEAHDVGHRGGGSADEDLPPA
ncbi:MAG TPA: hypothetical protein VF494_10475 [Candidatus Limnocylindrales bacterium]